MVRFHLEVPKVEYRNSVRFWIPYAMKISLGDGSEYNKFQLRVGEVVYLGVLIRHRSSVQIRHPLPSFVIKWGSNRDSQLDINWSSSVNITNLMYKSIAAGAK